MKLKNKIREKYYMRIQDDHEKNTTLLFLLLFEIQKKM